MQTTHDTPASRPPALPIPHAGKWSSIRQAGCCPVCGAWVKLGRVGKTEKAMGRFRVRRLLCSCPGGWFKTVEEDETI